MHIFQDSNQQRPCKRAEKPYADQTQIFPDTFSCNLYGRTLLSIFRWVCKLNQLVQEHWVLFLPFDQFHDDVTCSCWAHLPLRAWRIFEGVRRQTLWRHLLFPQQKYHRNTVFNHIPFGIFTHLILVRRSFQYGRSVFQFLPNQLSDWVCGKLDGIDVRQYQQGRKISKHYNSGYLAAILPFLWLFQKPSKHPHVVWLDSIYFANQVYLCGLCLKRSAIRQRIESRRDELWRILVGVCWNIGRTWNWISSAQSILLVAPTGQAGMISSPL